MIEKIYLIRHGMTEANKKKIYSGSSCERVCSEGIDSLFKVGRELIRFKIQKIYTSSLIRAVQTARIINVFLRVDIEKESNFEEMNMGGWQGLSEDEIAKKYPDQWRIWNTVPSKLKVSNRETLEQLQLRALKGIGRISKNSEWTRSLIVTHVAVIRALIIHYNKMNLDDYRRIEVPNGAVFLLNHNSGNKEIRRVL